MSSGASNNAPSYYIMQSNFKMTGFDTLNPSVIAKDTPNSLTIMFLALFGQIIGSNKSTTSLVSPDLATITDDNPFFLNNFHCNTNYITSITV